jgi:hypothetical protein
MRSLRLLQVVALLSFITSPTAWAGPITGLPVPAPTENTTSSSDESERQQGDQASVNFSALFDAIGPLIRVSAPIYLSLNAPKSSDFGGDSGDAFSGGGAADLGNVSFQIAVGDSPASSNVLPLVDAPAALPEPATLALMGPALFFVARRTLRSRRSRR